MVRSYGFPDNDIFFFESVALLGAVDPIEKRACYTLDKIHALNIPAGMRLCLMDSDIIVLRNIDHYLDFPHGSGYVNVCYDTDYYGMNGGVIIFERNEEEYKKALEAIPLYVNDE